MPCRLLKLSSGKSIQSDYLFRPVMKITLMNEGGNLPPGHDVLLFSRELPWHGIFYMLDIRRPLITQSWTTGVKVGVFLLLFKLINYLQASYNTSACIHMVS